MIDMNHQHLVLSAHGMKHPPRTSDDIVVWLLEMVEAIDMKVLMGPYAIRCDTEGNEGVTGIVVIETSHISCHCWDQVGEPFLKADVYSCKEFDPEIVLKMFNRFEPDHVHYMVIDRNHDNIVVAQGSEFPTA